MRDPIEVFKQGCLEWGFGPRFVSDASPFQKIIEARRQRSASLISSARAYEGYRGLIEIHADFIDNGEINAVADVRDDGRGYIGFLLGAVLVPTDIFLRMLSHPEVLPEIGDPTKEEVSPWHSEGMPLSWDDVEQWRLSNCYTGVSPRDRTRLLYAALLSEIAYDFLHLHEQAHITHGHVEYFRAAGVPFMLEMSTAADPRLACEDPLTRQTLEMDADASAASVSLMDCLRRRAKLPGTAVLEMTPARMVFAWSLAISTLFWLWGWEIDMASLPHAHHPPPALRCIMANAVALETVSRFAPDVAPAFGEIVAAAVQELTKAAACIGCAISPATAKSWLDGVRVTNEQDYSGSLLQRWKVIRPELLKYSYSTHLAP